MKATLTRCQMALVTVVLIAAAGCGSSTDSGDGGGNGDCTISLTGAQAASLDCSSALAIFAADENASVFTISNTAGSPGVLVTIKSPGEPGTTTYHSGDAGELGSVVVNGGTSAWAAVTADPSSQTAAAGSFTLTISSESTLSSDVQGKVFRVHGSLAATLPAVPSSAATGTVTLNATF
jgi:hypothetical protein